MPIVDAELGDRVVITHPDLVNIYGCVIGSGSKIGPFVEIQKNCRVGDRCKISSHSFLCEGVEIEPEVMIAHGVMFTNDLYPRACTEQGDLKGDRDWSVLPTLVKQGASLGSNATILAGVVIGRSAIVGCGSVVTRDVPDFAIVAGVPARVIGDARQRGAMIQQDQRH